MPSFYPKSRVLRERLVPADLTKKLDSAFNLLEAQLEPVDAPSDLEDLLDYGLLDGARAPVKAGQQTFYLDRSSVATPDGSTVIATHSGDGRWVLLPGADHTQELVFSLPLRGITAARFNFIGELRENIATAQTGNYTTDFPVANHHVMFIVNSLTGSGTLTITGASMSEASAVPVVGDTEVVTVDATGRYQSNKKWWEVTDITAAGFTAVNYDIGSIGYPDLGNQDFRITGYRIEAYADGTFPDIGIDMWKVQDDGDQKMTLVPFESIGVDADNVANQIVDGLRTGGADRSLNPDVASIWLDNTTLVFKQTDFDSYFTADEVTFESATKAEGPVVRLRGEDGAGGGAIANVDYITLWLRVALI